MTISNCTTKLLSIMFLVTRIAIEAAEKAKKILFTRQGLIKQMWIKHGKNMTHADIVTTDDIRCEKVICDTIMQAFPDHGILSEETKNQTDPKKYTHLWIIDPIDGTIAYTAGLPFYSVSIAYVVDGKLHSCALYLSATNEILWAETGRGAYIEKQRLAVKDTTWFNAIIALDSGTTYRTQALTKIAPMLAKDIRFLQITPGEASNLGYVAKGLLQGLICIFPDVWDYAAGMLLVQEAGGIISDLYGKPYNLFSKTGHVAASPAVHKKIVSFTQLFIPES